MNYFDAISSILMLVGATVLFTGLLWFIAHGFRDYAFPDILLFVSGVSIIAYAFTCWDRTKYPLLIALGGLVAFVAGIAADGFSSDKQAVHAFYLGVEAMEDEDYELAVKHFSVTISYFPDDLASRYNRALSYLHIGKHESAIEDAAVAILIDPDNADAYAVRAAAYQELGKEEKASLDAEKAIQLRE